MIGLRAEYAADHPDAIDAKIAYEEVSESCKQLEKTTSTLVSFFVYVLRKMVCALTWNF